ncbi:hypothetical protein Aca07nite_62560 [Actinoplanes capillaceus]|uniref:Uncharacterized protein n=1 Tax=Actinoplanes campanulatus TaxID=113559 RepID=A0ABQ3WRQ8_9ACTN|nr:hypothetical protein GCM10010109_54530 [Actinoplanes campanulatus]GID38228.1 hypothetical protein Aca09nite_47340 [Actinoplanes campanulatus]GID48981.1 hypothetical protein Aca07nite_62560 [Actinoplanes capillaceus]
MGQVAANHTPRRTRSATVDRQPGATPVINASSITDLGKACLVYIPTEIVTLYVVGTSALNTPGSPPAGGQWLLMIVFLALTPIAVWVSWLAGLRAQRKDRPRRVAEWPWVSILLATLAFAIWAFTLPGTPYETVSWYRPQVGSVVLVVGTIVIGYIGAVFESPKPPLLGEPDGQSRQAG